MIDATNRCISLHLHKGHTVYGNEILGKKKRIKQAGKKVYHKQQTVSKDFPGATRRADSASKLETSERQMRQLVFRQMDGFPFSKLFTWSNVS